MAPRKTEAPSLAEEVEEPKAKRSKEDAAAQKLAMSGMVTAAKHIAATKPNTKEGKEAAEALHHYQSLGRFDKEKGTIVANWVKAGKKFTFWSEYSKTRSKASSSSTGGATGWGTKFSAYFLQNIQFQCLLL